MARSHEPHDGYSALPQCTASGGVALATLVGLAGTEVW